MCWQDFCISVHLLGALVSILRGTNMFVRLDTWYLWNSSIIRGYRPVVTSTATCQTKCRILCYWLRCISEALLHHRLPIVNRFVGTRVLRRNRISMGQPSCLYFEVKGLLNRFMRADATDLLINPVAYTLALVNSLSGLLSNTACNTWRGVVGRIHGRGHTRTLHCLADRHRRRSRLHGLWYPNKFSTAFHWWKT